MNCDFYVLDNYKRSRLCILAASLMCLLTPVVAGAQADFEKGYQSYQSYHGTDFDTINLANGNLVLNIPLLSYEQRGGLPPVTISIRSNSTTFQSDPPFSNGPADTKQFEVPSGVLGSPAGQPHVVISPGGLYWKEQRITLEKAQLSRFVAFDDSGASHSLGGNIANSTAPYLGNIRYSIDGSDIMLTASATNPVVIDRRGNTGGLVDPNGNRITLQGPCATPAGAGEFYNASLPPWQGYAFGTASATTIIDSVGRVIPNPTYLKPTAAYSCLVDLDTAYYPSAATSDASCPAAQVANAIPGETSAAHGPTGLPLMASDAYTFPSQNGSTIQLKFCYQKINVSALLPNVQRQTTQINEVWPVLTGAILPNGTLWTFVYDNYGQVISVTMPTGATATYAYGGSTNGMRLACGNPPGEIPISGTPTWPFNNLMSSRMVTQRTVTSTNPSGTATTQQWTYNSTIGSGWGASPNQGNVTVTDATGNDVVHTFSLVGTPTYGQPICGPYETNVAYYQGSSTSITPVLIKQVTTQYTSTGTDHANPTNFSNYIANNVLPSTVTTTLYDGLGGTQVRQDAYVYDKFGTYQDYKGTTFPFSFGVKLGETESDFGAAGPGGILRTSLYTNQWQTYWKYWQSNLIDLPCATSIFTGTYGGTQPSCVINLTTLPSNQAALTLDFYDESGYVPSGVIGLQTTLYRWNNSGDATPISHTFYNPQGMPTEKLDPNGNATFIAYDSTGLYPNKITHPQTGSVTHVEIPTYDSGTGELLTHQDENQNLTHFQYDSMRRLTQTNYPDGGQETFAFNDTVPPSYVFTKTLNSASTFKETGLADTLGRKVQTQINSDPQGVVFANTTYDTLGRVATQTNPFRSTSEPTYGVTSFTYDAIDRKTIQTQPDGSKQMWCYQNLVTTAQTNCNAQLGQVNGTVSNNGAFVDFRDELSHDWQRTSDGLGRLTIVMEPNGTGTKPSMQTTYWRDALDNLQQVAQAGNGKDAQRFSRQFFFDSLSRLISGKNPETGVISYRYDANGNVITRVQGMVNTTTFSTYALLYCYDALNRKTAEYMGPTQIQNCTSPSQVLSTPGDTLMTAYTYDTTSLGTPPNNAIGHLTDEVEYTSSSAVWERSPYQYDTMGRLLKEQQCALGSCATPYSFTYGYDFAGNVLSTTNGLDSVSPITIGYSYDNVARLATVSAVTPTTGIWSGNGFPTTLYTAKEYGAAGLLSATYGSSGTKPMFLSRTYDKRLRVADNTLSSAATQASATITLACIQTGCAPGTGKAKVVIGGVPTSASTTGTTMAALATSLATAINSTDGMPVTATASSNVVTVTAIEYGKDGEVSLAASTTSGATFTATASAANLGGDTSTVAYEFGLTYATNGNVLTAADTIIGNWTFTYDTLNRLTNATASTAGIITPFGTYKTQCWTYDSFGNRTGEGEMTTATTCPNPISSSNHSNVALYNASNQITSNSVSTFVYDQDGNITNDGLNKYAYDLDGRICAVTTAATGGAITQYVYDAEGRRVAKGSLTTFPSGTVCSAPTAANGFTSTALYLRGEHGDQDTELNGIGVWQHTNVFAGGGLTATYDTGTKATLSFNFSDWLGSKRLQSNFNGSTQNSWTSDPFGAYLHPLGSGADATEHHFTGKERDSETGNDYFVARYYESGLGRWVTPDKPFADQHPGSPQSWNLYAYTLNNPLKFVDSDGKCTAPKVGPGQVGICVDTWIKRNWFGPGGRGDGANRVPVANDPKSSFRTEERWVIDYKTHEIVSHEKDAHRSGLLFEKAGPRGSVESSAEHRHIDNKGNFFFTDHLEGENGWGQALSGLGPIEHDIVFKVSSKGDVDIDSAARKAFPSLEIWSYDENGKSHELRYIPERDPSDLNGPEDQYFHGHQSPSGSCDQQSGCQGPNSSSTNATQPQ